MLNEPGRRNELTMKCMEEKWNKNKKNFNNPIILIGGRTLTKIVENYYKAEDKFTDTRFLESPLGPFDIIEIALDLDNGQAITIAGSSYSFDPSIKSNYVYRFMSEHIYRDVYEWDFPVPKINVWI